MSLALLRDAALQREPGGVSAPAQVPVVPLDGDLEGVQLRYRAVDLADRPGDLWLAAPACPPGRGLDRGIALRSGRVYLGPPGAYQHDQRPGQCAVCDLGAGMVVERGKWRGVVLAAFALACEVFAGHLQDVLLTVGPCRSLRAVPVRHRAGRAGAVARSGDGGGLVGLGLLLSAVQWIPSKELLDRSPRAGGLSYPDLTFASWSPELIPTLVMREAYGTRARDTDWMNGFLSLP